MKVAFVSTLYAPHETGGAERTVRTLAESLVRHGHQALAISLAPDGRAARGEIGGVRTYYVPLANLHWPFANERPSWLRRLAWHAIDAYNPVMGARVGEILARERPDVVQAGNLLGFSVAVWRAARRLDIPVVQMLHDYYLACPNASMFKAGRNCAAQCTRCRVLGTPRRRLSNIPVAVTSLSRRTLEKVEGAGLFRGVPHRFIAHGASQLHASPPPRPDKRPGEPLVVGCLGRIERNKGIEVLLDAVARLPAGTVRVLLAGRGEPGYTEELRARSAGSDIAFVGFVRPAELFAQIDLLVVPSLWEEPLGRVIYEAYEYGIPSAVSRAGGMPEIVEPGRTGFVFEPGNDSELAALLHRQVRQGWAGADFFAACRAKSREFDIDRDPVFDRYARIWRTACAWPDPPAAPL